MSVVVFIELGRLLWRKGGGLRRRQNHWSQTPTVVCLSAAICFGFRPNPLARAFSGDGQKRTPWARWRAWACHRWGHRLPPQSMLPSEEGRDCSKVPVAWCFPQLPGVRDGGIARFFIDSRSHIHPWIVLRLLFPNSAFHQLSSQFFSLHFWTWFPYNELFPIFNIYNHSFPPPPCLIWRMIFLWPNIMARRQRQLLHTSHGSCAIHP